VVGRTMDSEMDECNIPLFCILYEIKVFGFGRGTGGFGVRGFAFQWLDG